MERLTEYDFGPPNTPGNRKHPWEHWLDGSIWRIRRFQDFTCAIHTLRAQLYTQSRMRGKKMRIHVEDAETLVIQAYDREEE